MQDLVLRARELARRQREATVPTEECFDPKLIDELADCIDRYLADRQRRAITEMRWAENKDQM